MKQLTIMVMLSFVVGCAQLMNGDIQPVVLKSAKDKVFFTTCSGAVEDWGSCHKKAYQNCPNGFDVLRKYDDTKGIVRELTFQCKKQFSSRNRC